MEPSAVETEFVPLAVGRTEKKKGINIYIIKY